MSTEERLIEVPDSLPLVMQDITIMRCTVCGAIVPGMWQITRETMRAGIDHVLDRHRAMVSSRKWLTTRLVLRSVSRYAVVNHKGMIPRE